MDFDRRGFLKLGAVAAAGTAIGPVAAAVTGQSPAAAAGKRLGMVIDADKCPTDCTACVDACRKENNVPRFTEPELDMHWIRKIKFHPKGVEGAQERSFPAMCFHCENPPCAHVCPVAATFIRPDGIVQVDKHRCIGCRYCIVACPYKARSFVSKPVEPAEDGNPNVPSRTHGVVEKCTLCAHRVDEGKEPACVEACRATGQEAMVFGDLHDQASAAAELLRTGRARQLRADLGCQPGVYYMGL
ncbi:MAG: 4Fe-4S dicluster domain-containing protein [Nitrospinota bacterium]|nr:4Fe-4S dicluster domain-containing protein [Nitrospinota bacterium]